MLYGLPHMSLKTKTQPYAAIWLDKPLKKIDNMRWFVDDIIWVLLDYGKP